MSLISSQKYVKQDSNRIGIMSENVMCDTNPTRVDIGQ